MGDSSFRSIVEQNGDRYLTWLEEACSIPSVAGRDDDLDAMAAWLREKLREVGGEPRTLKYGTAPDALLCSFGSGARSFLVYDHYDVQPVDPIELWTSDPFKPERRDGRFFARGAADNKGDLVARLAGLDVYRRLHGDPSAEIKVLVEGEEETGSKNFDALVSEHGEALMADGCVWEGMGIDHRGRPEFVFGAKGLAYVELNHRGLNDDQHSSLAVVLPSPVWHMVEALSTLRAADGRVTIEGFYDDVQAPTDADEEMLAAFPFEEEAERERVGIESFVAGDTGIDLLRRYFFEPTCNIAGIIAGFTVPGTSKTVLPKEVMAKLDMRLVPDQDPNDIVAKLRKHLDSQGYGDISVSSFSMEHPVRSPADSIVAATTLRAAANVFQDPPAVSPMMIGTGPMYPVAATLGIPTVSPAGVCRPDSNIHAPNENCREDDFLKIVEFSAEWIRLLGTA